MTWEPKNKLDDDDVDVSDDDMDKDDYRSDKTGQLRVQLIVIPVCPLKVESETI